MILAFPQKKLGDGGPGRFRRGENTMLQTRGTTWYPNNSRAATTTARSTVEAMVDDIS